jgi:hypothetical protein
MTVTISPPGLMASDDVSAGPLPANVTTICSLWPAASDPAAGVTARPAGGVIANAATGPPFAVRVNVPVGGPPVAGAVSRTTSGDADSVPRVIVGVGLPVVGLGVVGRTVRDGLGAGVAGGLALFPGVADELPGDGVAAAGSVVPAGGEVAEEPAD